MARRRRNGRAMIPLLVVGGLVAWAMTQRRAYASTNGVVVATMYHPVTGDAISPASVADARALLAEGYLYEPFGEPILVPSGPNAGLPATDDILFQRAATP